MKSLPEHVAFYKRTPEFNKTMIPAGLLKNYQTKDGVWVGIVVLSGHLLNTIETPFEQISLDKNTFGVVEPKVLHQMKPVGAVQFCVAFYQ